LTGDVMHQDANGHFFFIGRNDDVITSAGFESQVQAQQQLQNFLNYGAGYQAGSAQMFH